uniref:Uncharacterized protein n=1 Tax=Candidatus Kentrum sp. TC TaxID=2126339 RepID=A0A451A1N9_9GAMM|nr:MAG: hypothetical protein BECKTC1821F_GA0114240_103835 [Candidatus Kentron sp. TC]
MNRFVRKIRLFFKKHFIICLSDILVITLAILLAAGLVYHFEKIDNADIIIKRIVQIFSFLLVVLPTSWIVTVLHRFSGQLNEHKDHWIQVITTAMIPLIVVGASLLALEDQIFVPINQSGGPGETTIAVGEIASTVIVYALTLLAAIILIELIKQRDAMSEESKNIRNKLDNASRETQKTLSEGIKWYEYSDEFSAQIHGDIQRDLLGSLIEEWANTRNAIKNNAIRNKEDHEGTENKNQETQDNNKEYSRKLTLFDSLLSTYFKEEKKDFSGTLEKIKVPNPVWPFAPGKRPVEDSGVLFMSTNVGFYAEFLTTVIEHFPGEARSEGHVMCWGIVTQMLPPHWWNWPFTENEWKVYKPIDNYREAQRKLTTKHGGKIFRRVLLRNKDQQRNTRSFQKIHTIDAYNGMKDWKFIYRGEGKPVQVDIHPAKYGYLPLVKEIKWINGKTIKTEDRAYLMSEEQTLEHDDWVLGSKVFSHFNEYVHGEKGGNTHYVLIDYDTFSKSFDQNGLNECLDIMFIGECGEALSDIWPKNDKEKDKQGNRPEKPVWWAALLATMSTESETMFLTVVWDNKRVEELWDSISGTISGLDSVGS